MRHILFLLALLLLAPTPAAYPAPAYPAPAGLVAPQPHLTAQWNSATSATIQWSQSGRACLYRQPQIGAAVFVECIDRVGTIVLTLGGPETDAAYRPTSGDVYILVTNETTYRAPLIGRAVYLGVWRG